MSDDPIIDEVRAIRDDIAREHGYDVNSIFRMLRRREAKSDIPHVRFSPKRLEISQGRSQPGEAAQAGAGTGHGPAAPKRSRRRRANA